MNYLNMFFSRGILPHLRIVMINFRVVSVGLFLPVPVSIVKKYWYFDVGPPRAASSASGSVGV